MPDHPERETTLAATGVRQCPSIGGDARMLITHAIDVTTCMTRQREFYHKCPRCLYRGKPASFVLGPPREAEAQE